MAGHYDRKLRISGKRIDRRKSKTVYGKLVTECGKAQILRRIRVVGEIPQSLGIQERRLHLPGDRIIHGFGSHTGICRICSGIEHCGGCGGIKSLHLEIDVAYISAILHQPLETTVCEV